MSLTRLIPLLAALGALLAPASALAQGSRPAERLPGEVLARGLDNPRGLVLGRDGAVFVAEAGRGGDGPCVERDGQRLCLGATGAVTQVKRRRKQRILKGLPSLAPDGGEGAIGPSDVTRNGGQVFTVIGHGARPSERAALGELGSRLGWVIENRDGTPFPIADIAGHAGDVVTNPFGIARVGGQMYVTDVGAKSVVLVQRGGRLRTRANLDIVPSAVGNAGKRRLYVTDMSTSPWPKEDANVLRIAGGGDTARVFAKKFTNIIDVVPAGFGSLYVLEGSQGGSAGNRSGRVLHMEPGGLVRHIVGRDLPSPGGLGVDPLTGKIYVTLNSDKPGEGALVRLPGHGTSHASFGTPQGQYPDMTKATRRGFAEGQKLWKATLRSARRFEFRAARRAGFRWTSARKKAPVPGVFHLRRDSYDSDGREMDPRRPESLVYYNSRSGKKTLVAFMYRAESQNFPNVTRGLLGWHRHGSSARALPMTHIWLTKDLRSAMANCLPVPELEMSLNWKFEGSSDRVSGLESLPCGKPGDVVTG